MDKYISFTNTEEIVELDGNEEDEMEPSLSIKIQVSPDIVSLQGTERPIEEDEKIEKKITKFGKFSSQTSINTTQRYIPGFSEVGKSIFLPKLRKEFFPEDYSHQKKKTTRKSRKNIKKQKHFSLNKNYPLSTRLTQNSKKKPKNLSSVYSSRNRRTVSNRSKYEFKITKKLKKNIFKQTESYLKTVSNKNKLDSILSVNLKPNKNELNFQFKMGDYEKNIYESSKKKSTNPHLINAKSLIRDPTEMSQDEKNQITLRKFFTFDRRQSKEKYLELLNSGMDNEIFETIMYELAMLQKNNNAKEVIKGVEKRVRLKDQRKAIKHEEKRFENPFIIGKQAQEKAKQSNKKFMGICKEIINGVKEAVKIRENDKRRKLRKKRRKERKLRSMRNQPIDYGVIKEESQSMAYEPSIDEEELYQSSKMISPRNMTQNSKFQIDSISPVKDKKGMRNNKGKSTNFDFNLDTLEDQISPSAGDSLNNSTNTDMSPIKLARSLSPNLSKINPETLNKFPSMKGKNFDNLTELITKAKKNFSFNPRGKRRKRKRLTKSAKKRKALKKILDKMRDRNKGAIIKANIQNARRFKLFQEEKKKKFFEENNKNIEKAKKKKYSIKKKEISKLVSKINERAEKLKKTTRKLALRRRMKKGIRISLTLIFTFNFFYQIQRFLNYSKTIFFFRFFFFNFLLKK